MEVLPLGQLLLGEKKEKKERKKEKKEKKEKEMKNEEEENNPKNSGHYVPLQRPRAVHALRSDQYSNI